MGVGGEGCETVGVGKRGELRESYCGGRCAFVWGKYRQPQRRCRVCNIFISLHLTSHYSISSANSFATYHHPPVF